ncbi:hypothetical protein RQP46_008025 [Phenoliferia psychrophenolica]
MSSPDTREKASTPVSGTESSHVDEKDAAAFAAEKGGVDVHDILPTLEKISLDDAKAIIRDTVKERQLDPNFDRSLLKRAQKALDEEALSHDRARALVEEIKLEASLIDDSPYLEVRASVDPTDDYNMPVNTFCAQVIAYPMGKFLEWCLPTKKFRILGRECSFNPGPFNQKEHMLITIMANVTFGGGGVYSSDLIFVQRLPQYFNQLELGASAGYQILMTLSTQMMGFGVAGISRRFLVYPPSMIWPQALATVALNRSFHNDVNPPANGWTITRLRLFTIIFFAYGFYFVLPDAIMGFLSYFNWMTWIAPNNVKLALITGSVTGLGLNPWTNLWIDPLITPLHATLNLFAGMCMLGFPMICIIYFNNIFNTAYLPINSSKLFDHAGKSFFCFFAFYTSTIVHVVLYHYAELSNGFKAIYRRHSPREAYKDVHNRLMLRYAEVPEWWFLSVLALSIFGIIATEKYDLKLPVWGVFFGALQSLIFVIPVGIVMAITNFELTINVLAEVIGGYAIPGKPLAVMLFKTYGVVPAAQAIGYSKASVAFHIHHNCKIPPRSQFAAQIIASIWACFGNISISICLLLAAIWDLMTCHVRPLQVSKFTCVSSYQVFFNSGVQWGAIGPARLYSPGKMYASIMYGFLFGALAPIACWIIARRYPTSWWRYVSAPAFIYGGVQWAPGNLSYMIPVVYLALYFHIYVRRRARDFWAKYTYIIATAFKSSIGLFGILWFFAILYNDYAPDWWPNNVSYAGCDGSGCRLLPIPDVGYFGPGPTVA